jgi:hypothetical protein
MNHSTAPVQIVLYVDGYFTATTAASAPATPGAFVPIAPKRVLDTRSGAGGNKRGRVTAKSHFTAQIGGKAAVPASSAAVVGVLTVLSPARNGGAIAWQSATTRPSANSVQFVAGKDASALVVVPLGSDGRIALRNESAGKVTLVFDLIGYYVAGEATQMSTTSFVVATDVLGSTSVKANRAVTVRVSSAGRIPMTNVAAVAAVVGVSSPAGAGTVAAYPDGTPNAGAVTAQFVKGEGASTALLLPVSSTGRITLQNKSKAVSRLSLTVVGYVLKSTAVDPYSVSHYIRRRMTNDGADLQWMQNLGMQDAATRSRIVVLDIGAQEPPTKTDVWLSGTNIRTDTPAHTQADKAAYWLTYSSLVSLLQAYLAGFGPHPEAIVAVATSNDNDDWTSYTAAQRGADWWNKVIAPLQGTGMQVYGADDIESAFGTQKYSDALGWENAYLAAGGSASRLVYIGSANGCPSTQIGQPGACSNGWTQAQYYQLAGGTSPSRILALPQIYNNSLAIQWSNIDLAGGGQIQFLGALTEAAACAVSGQQCGSWSSQAGLAALIQQLVAAQIPVPDNLLATDLDIQK